LLIKNYLYPLDPIYTITDFDPFTASPKAWAEYAALAIRETFRRCPRIEILETNCYSANLPIIHINQTMGYTLRESALQFRVAHP
jgi:hypothetical protein